MTKTLRSPHGWTFILNDRYSPASYRTQAIARQRMAMHKTARTAYYYA